MTSLANMHDCRHATASSTAAREAALRGDRERLLEIVAPKVADALLERAQR